MKVLGFCISLIVNYKLFKCRSVGFWCLKIVINLEEVGDFIVMEFRGGWVIIVSLLGNCFYLVVGFI